MDDDDFLVLGCGVVMVLFVVFAVVKIIKWMWYFY